jgi:hypothetical protein
MRRLRCLTLSLAGALLLPTVSPADEVIDVGTMDAGPRTRILDPAAAQRLKRNKGITLQWIDWNRRGEASVIVDRGGRWLLHGEQGQAGGPGRLTIQGKVTEIGRDYFLFDGTVRIADTPDKGRSCEANKVWRFAVTQNRRYWRIREFEWCDGLTDYVDIYF